MGMAPLQADDRLVGRVALVTGGSRGIGRAIALALARAGCNVAVVCRTRIVEARAVADEARALGVRAVAAAADVGAREDVMALYQTIEHELDAPSIVINNAGIAEPASIDALSLEDWNRTLQANLSSAFLVTQRGLGAMRTARWGRIVNLSSAAAQTGGVVGPHYAASKAGLIGLTRSLAQTLAPQGITVNAVLPALVYTDMLAARSDITPARIPVGRFGNVDEVAEAVMSLLRNGYMTGQCLHVNGGTYFA